METLNSVSEISQIALTVSAVPQAKRFYGDILGLKCLFDAGPNLSFYAAGSVRIMLTTSQGSGAIGRNSILYFKTESVETTYREVIKRGAVSQTAPHRAATLPDHELWMAFVRDPDGNPVGLMEERR